MKGTLISEEGKSKIQGRNNDHCKGCIWGNKKKREENGYICPFRRCIKHNGWKKL